MSERSRPRPSEMEREREASGVIEPARQGARPRCRRHRQAGRHFQRPAGRLTLRASRLATFTPAERHQLSLQKSFRFDGQPPQFCAEIFISRRPAILFLRPVGRPARPPALASSSSGDFADDFAAGAGRAKGDGKAATVECSEWKVVVVAGAGALGLI